MIGENITQATNNNAVDVAVRHGVGISLEDLFNEKFAA